MLIFTQLSKSTFTRTSYEPRHLYKEALELHKKEDVLALCLNCHFVLLVSGTAQSGTAEKSRKHGSKLLILH